MANVYTTGGLIRRELITGPTDLIGNSQYTVNSIGTGGFTVTLPPAIGSGNVIRLSGQTAPGDRITVAVPSGEILNSVTNGTLAYETFNAGMEFIDIDVNRWVGRLLGGEGVLVANSSLTNRSTGVVPPTLLSQDIRWYRHDGTVNISGYLDFTSIFNINVADSFLLSFDSSQKTYGTVIANDVYTAVGTGITFTTTFVPEYARWNVISDSAGDLVFYAEFVTPNPSAYTSGISFSVDIPVVF